MEKIEVGKWYKRKSDGVKVYCYRKGLEGSRLGFFSYKESNWCNDVLFPDEVDLLQSDLQKLFQGYNLSRLSMALGKHRSYLNKMIQQGVSDELYERIKSKITIDWTSEKPLHVNDNKHVPYTVKPVNCVLPKHKEWLQELMMNGCVKL